MKHIIDSKEVDIDWEQVEIIDNHGSGCVDWMVKGEGDDGKEYWGDGNYQHSELVEVNYIEEGSKNEVWKDVSGYEGLYRISSHGQLLALQKPKGIRKYCVTKLGYMQASITINKFRRKIFIHRLVAQAFLPNTENKTQINHKDGNKRNNHVDNLEWVSSQENILHAYRTGLMTMVGGRNANAKLTDMDVFEIKTKMKDGEAISSILKDYKTTASTLYNIKNGHTWKHIEVKTKDDELIDVIEIETLET